MDRILSNIGSVLFSRDYRPPTNGTPRSFEPQVLRDDIMTIPEDRIPDTKTLATLVWGKGRLRYGLMFRIPGIHT